MNTYDLSIIPFSMAGSFLMVTSRGISSNRLLYKTCSHRPMTTPDMAFLAPDFFEIALHQDQREVPYTWQAFPTRLELKAQDGLGATLIFGDPDTLLVHLDGVELKLVSNRPYSTVISPSDHQINLVDWPGGGIHQFRAFPESNVFRTDPASTEIHAHWSGSMTGDINFSGGGGAIRYTQFETLWNEPLPDVKVTMEERKREFDAWMNLIPDIPQRYSDAAEQAWFLLWNCQVPASGALTRPAIYMSKFWMNNIWAWDNCFNAIAIARANPDLAWNQLLLFFDHQDPNGMVPDMVNDLLPIYLFNKPPIHGWTVKKLVERAGLEKSLPYLSQLYSPLCRLTEWWYALRDYDHDGMCQYHHGNDSGWDNATAFDQGYPTEGADLAAHLVLQAEGLAFIADALGKHDEGARWRKQAEIQLCTLLSQGVRNGRFFSPLNGKDSAPESESLLNYIPAALGHRLPPDIHNAIIADLSPGGPFLTEFGLATESPGSSKYESDGYWRGPIWAPSTHLIFDGLVDAGDYPLAQVIAERFCDLCARDSGFWENYDALTGEGLRCPGYSWTASVFLVLAEWLKGRE